MGGTTLITKGILGPIEGDVKTSIIGLPIIAEVTPMEVGVETHRDVHEVTQTPDIQEVEAIIRPLDTDISVQGLEVEARIEE